MKFSRVTWICLALSLCWFWVVFGVKIPENSDFIVHFTSFEKVIKIFLGDDILEIGPVPVFGKDSFDGAFELFTVL